MQDLNTLIDAAEALEVAAAGAAPSSPPSAAAPSSVDPFYSLTFFHHKPQRQNANKSSAGHSPARAHTGAHLLPPSSRPSHASRNGGDERARGGNGSEEAKPTGDPAHREDEEAVNLPLVELRAELRFAPSLSADPSRSLRTQLRRQLEGLLKRVPTGSDGDAGSRDPEEGDGDDDSEREKRMMSEGIRVREGETEEDFYGDTFGGMFDGSRRGSGRGPPRDGIRMER